MTREEAIKLVDDRMCFGRGKWSDHHMPERDIYWEAGEMAIKALEQLEPCDDDKGCSNCMYSGRPTYKSPCSECRDKSQWEMKPISRSHENGAECEDAVSRQAIYDALMAEPLKWDDSSHRGNVF